MEAQPINSIILVHSPDPISHNFIRCGTVHVFMAPSIGHFRSYLSELISDRDYLPIERIGFLDNDATAGGVDWKVVVVARL